MRKTLVSGIAILLLAAFTPAISNLLTTFFQGADLSFVGDRIEVIAAIGFALVNGSKQGREFWKDNYEGLLRLMDKGAS